MEMKNANVWPVLRRLQFADFSPKQLYKAVRAD